MSAADVVKKFGGQTSLSQLIGVNQSAIAYWVKRGTIPAKWHAQLFQLATDRAIQLTPGDLIMGRSEAPAEPPSPYLVPTAIAVRHSPQAAVETAPATSQFLFYASKNGATKVQVILGGETVWASQRGMAEIFDVDVRTVNEHLSNIFASEELDPSTTIRNFRTVVDNGKEYQVNFYNLDAIISVGYRVSSYQATQFRKWATTVLREFLIKGFAMDDERLKQGNRLFDKDYFDELLERIREIRASEKRFYQKVLDLYAECSADYDKNAPISHHFFKHVQDKLHFAVHGHTSAELIQLRANHRLPNMGVQSFEGAKVTKSESKVGKNYLYKQEAEELNRIVSMYLDFAENQVRRNRLTGTPITMNDWIEKLDSFLVFNGFGVLEGYGKVRREYAEQCALAEFEKFTAIQKSKPKADFEEVSGQIRSTRKIPKSIND